MAENTLTLLGSVVEPFIKQYQWRSKRVLQVWFWRRQPNYMVQWKQYGIQHKSWTTSPFWGQEARYWKKALEKYVPLEIYSITCHPARDWITVSFHLPKDFDREPNNPQKLGGKNVFTDPKPHVINPTQSRYLTLPAEYDFEIP